MDKIIVGAFGLIGVLLGAALTVVRESRVEKKKRLKDAEYLAIRVVCILDRYIDGCAEVVSDDGLNHGQTNKDGYHEAQVSNPKLNLESISVDWKSLSANLMYEILSLPNDIEGANQMIYSVAEYESFPPDFGEYFEERQFQYSTLGLKASKLVKELRIKYSIPEREYNNWNPIEYISQRKQEIQKRRIEREKGCLVKNETGKDALI